MSRRVRVTLGALLCICGLRGAGQGAAAAGGGAGAPASASASAPASASASVSASAPASVSEALSFISERSGNRDVYLIAADGQSEQALTCSAAHESNLALTPDGRYLLLAAAQGVAERDRRFRFALAPLSLDPGLPRKPLGALPPALFSPRAVLLNPSFAPDGKSLYFESESSGLRDLFQLPLTASYRPAGEPRQLTRNPEGNFAPSVCARGDFLAFTSSRDRVSELYRMRRDGSDLRRLTYSAGSEWQPRCHPSGERIYFVSDRDGADRIYSVHVNGAEPRRLTRRGLDPALVEDAPTISPDGRLLAFILRGAGVGSRLHVVELATGAELTVATPAGLRASEPAWSLGHGGRPLRLAVTLGGEPGGAVTPQVYVTDPQYHGVQQLTRAPGPNWHPLWVR